jgi:drug/metabolite transporter (DMT)-like permease
MPIWTLVISSIFQIESITKIKLFAIFVAILGVFIALGDNFNETNILLFTGDAIVMLGVICSSIFASLSSNYIEKYGNINVLLFALISGVSATFVFALILGTPFNGSLDFNPLGWFCVSVLGIPCGAVMIFCWGKALQYSSPTQATLCMGFHPLTAMLFGSLLLEEPITLNLFIGFFLVFSAIFFIQIKSKT